MGVDQKLEPEPEYDETMPLIDLFGCDSKGIDAINAVGLADASAFGRTLGELSVGQRARAILGLGLISDGDIIVIDEYLAHLDRPTAKAVAWSTQRAIRRYGKTGVFVTAHDDLAEYLAPDFHIRAGWEEKNSVIEREDVPQRCSILDEVEYSRGTTADWKALKSLHYAAGDPKFIHSVWIAKHPEIVGPAAVLVLTFPDLQSGARNLATDDRYKNSKNPRIVKQLNKEVVKIARIVVCPQLRGIGIASEMIEYILPHLDVRYVECSTSMSRWTGFLRRLGFREIPQTTHPTEAKLYDWATQARPPAEAHIDGQALARWIETMSVRKRRTARRLVYLYFFHFVKHRHTKGRVPANVPGPADPDWPEAFDLAARRMRERPSYWIMGPMDPMTGLPTDEPVEAVSAA